MQDHRVYVDLRHLVDQQLHAEGFSFLPKQAIHTLLSGRHRSRLRGRGLSFEELRNYRVGDDIRTLDWKVTNRTRKPHVRVFTEERERDVLLLVDQRSHMFFGSQERMKSVTAAELAALAIWRVLSVKDRVGALVFNDQSIEKVKPQRSRKSAMQILHHIVDMNHQLSAANHAQNAEQLDCALKEAERLCRHDCLVVLASDLHGLSQRSVQRIKRIKMHNDFIVARVFDPLEQNLPSEQPLIFSDGELQIQVNAEFEGLGKRFSSSFSQELTSLQLEFGKYGVPVLAVDTVAPPHQQLRDAIGVANEPREGSDIPVGRAPAVGEKDGV